MKTYNYGINLMVPMQINKEIIFNESLSTIDNFCNSTITDFIDSPPQDIIIGQKYIIITGEQTGHICYCTHASKGWQFLKPQTGMIMFVSKKNAFFTFENDKWNNTNSANNVSPQQTYCVNTVSNGESFKSISAKFEVPSADEYLYLYLNDNCLLDLTKLKVRHLTIILKQNYQNVFKIQWPYNILWKNKIPHQMTHIPNSIDIVRLYRLIESEHYIGEIIGQDYKF